MTAPPRRVLVSTFGSAGDLFPLIPLVLHMRELGYDVRCAVPRVLGLYLRAWHLPALALGSGSEMRVLDDNRIVSTRCGGWASWRRVASHYIAPQLEDDVAVVERVIEDWAPDLVVTSTFAAAARVAAARRAVPQLTLSIYPQHVEKIRDSRGFGMPIRRVVADLCGMDVRDQAVTDLAWGVGPSTVLLHDPAVLGPTMTDGAEVVGFPYWDGAEPSDEVRQVQSWIRESAEPTVLVTLGSFLGANVRTVWETVAAATKSLGVRSIFLGPRANWEGKVFERRSDLLATSFVPLSLVLPDVAAVVHHGGIGTTFASLNAARPAVVLPQAFDQPFNARATQRVRCGVDGSQVSADRALTSVLEDESMLTAAADLRKRLIPASVAVSRAVELVTARMG